MGFSRQEYWSGLIFLSPVDHILPDLSTMTRPSWVAPQAWLSFIELDKAVVVVWLDWLVFCDYGFSVSALWCPLATPTILLGFLLLWAWGISSWPLQQSAAAANVVLNNSKKGIFHILPSSPLCEIKCIHSISFSQRRKIICSSISNDVLTKH